MHGSLPASARHKSDEKYFLTGSPRNPGREAGLCVPRNQSPEGNMTSREHRGV